MDKEMDIGRYIRQKRLEKGMTIRQIALYADCSSSYLSMLERGVRGQRGPSPAMLKRLSVPLGVPYEILMTVAGYQRDSSQELDGSVIRLLRESLGEEQQPFAKRIGLSLEELQLLEKQEVFPETLQIIFNQLFASRRSLSKTQRDLIHQVEDTFNKHRTEHSRKLEKLLQAYLNG